MLCLTPMGAQSTENVENFYFLFVGFPYVIAPVFSTPAFFIHAIYFCRYDDNLSLIGKRIVDFLLVLIGHFSLGATAEGLRADID